MMMALIRIPAIMLGASVYSRRGGVSGFMRVLAMYNNSRTILLKQHIHCKLVLCWSLAYGMPVIIMMMCMAVPLYEYGSSSLRTNTLV